MSDHPSNPKLDDELLSAYIDGELTASERAAVEARLAIDPAAQKLVHELRSVSQSVQAIPTATLGRDLSQEILRRARQATPSPSPSSTKSAAAESTTTSEPTTLIDTMPKIRAFGSKRSWIWASLVLAAGLLIMFLQPRDETNNLPPIAARDREVAEMKPADEVADSNGRLPASATVPASPPPANMAAADRYSHDNLGALASPQSGPTATDGFASGGGQKIPDPSLSASAPPPAAGRGRSMNKPDQTAPAPIADSDSLASSDKSLPHKLPRSVEPEGRLGGAPGSATGDPEQHKAEVAGSSSSAQPFTIVRLVASPAALRSGSFERLLTNHQIEFVSPSANKSRVIGGELAKPVPDAPEFKLKAAQHAESNADQTELVLVEAPAQAIQSFLADLNKNATDFPSIAVSEESSQLLADAKDTSLKHPAEDHSNLSRFNRGLVPNTPQDATELFSYWDAGKSQEPATEGAQPTDKATNESVARRLRLSAPSHPNFRHARVREEQGAQRQLGAATTAGDSAARTQSAIEATTPQSRRNDTNLAEAEQNKAPNQTVLFVIIPESPAPSGPPTDDRPK